MGPCRHPQPEASIVWNNFFTFLVYTAASFCFLCRIGCDIRLRICPVWREGGKKQRSKCQRHQPGVKLPAATPKPICMRKSGCLKARSSSELAVFIVCWTKTALTTWAGKNQSAIGGYSHVWHSTNGRVWEEPIWWDQHWHAFGQPRTPTVHQSISPAQWKE